MKNNTKPYEQKTGEQPKNQVPFAVIEAYKAIRTNLMFAMPNAACKMFEVSSPSAGEGKSTCAVNLAVAYSQLGQRVLLLDADLRKPSIHRKLHLNNAKGLSSILVGFCPVEEAITHINPNFDVIVSGPLPPNPAELLSSDSMGDLLDRMRGTYDCVIIDTPPLNVVSDALALSPKTEGIVMILQNNRTTHDHYQKAAAGLEFAGAKLLGVVINDSDEKSARYKYSGKKYKYGYRY